VKEAMQVIADASVLIDLMLGGILVQASRLELGWAAADTTVDELDEVAGTVQAVLALESLELSLGQVEEAEALAAQNRPLSLPDCHALVLARSEGALLLTGDQKLRRAAERCGVDVHGTLWLLDEMLAACALTPQRAAEALTRMRRAGSRLPETDCEERLARWRGRS
jgi:predicted nucleic acid-binding protein